MPTKGVAPLMTSNVVIPRSGGAICFTRKIASAIGGVMKAVWRLTITMMANHIGSKPAVSINGEIIGTTIKRIGSQPMKKPRAKTANIVIPKKPQRPPGAFSIKYAITC